MWHAAAQLDPLSQRCRSDPGGQPGRVTQVRTYWWQNYNQASWKPKPIDVQALDWKMWLGGAPDQPFSEEKYYRWRWFWNFGGGGMTDLFTHWIDVAHWAMKSDTPREAQMLGGQVYFRGVGLPRYACRRHSATRASMWCMRA